jgi:S-adenosylmethionine synthetase
MSEDYTLTSESVSEGHPDKVCDQISDAILDAYLIQDQLSRVACECMIAKNLIVIAGEITSTGKVDHAEIAKDVIRSIGYDSSFPGFDVKKCNVMTSISKQSVDISRGVAIGAGDSGMMYGYAVNETEELMPLPILLSHKLLKELSNLRKNKTFSWLKPDSKAQTTVKYLNRKPILVSNIVLSTQHGEEIELDELRELIKEQVIYKLIPEALISKDIKILINPAGRFIEGGPSADTGLTGRKIIVDTYGGACPHGGGAFSGKDPTKVDRSGAYMMRYIAKNIVAAELADRCTLNISYAIGVADPISIMINLHGTGKVDECKLKKMITEIFDLKPKSIINTLNLRNPIYFNTASYGHFGRNEKGFTWEQTNKIDDLRMLI